MLPVLLLCILGVFEFGRLLVMYSMVSNAARDAARYGSVTGIQSGIPQYSDCEGIRNLVKRGTSSLFHLPDSDISIGYDHGDLPVYAECVKGVEPNPPLSIGDRIVVSITTTYTTITPINLPSLPVSFSSARPLLKGGFNVAPTPIP